MKNKFTFWLFNFAFHRRQCPSLVAESIVSISVCCSLGAQRIVAGRGPSPLSLRDRGVVANHRIVSSPVFISRSFFSTSSSPVSSLGETPPKIPFEKVFVINLDRRKDRWRHVYHQLTNIVGFPPSAIERVSAVDGQQLLLYQRASPCSFSSPPSGVHSFSASATEKRIEKEGWKTEVLDRLVSSNLLSRLGRLRLVSPVREQIWGMDLTPGGVGCALSHLEVWRRVLLYEGSMPHISPSENKEKDGRRFMPIALSSKRTYLVVEDDAVCSSSFLRDYHQRVTIALSMNSRSQNKLEKESELVLGVEKAKGENKSDALSLPSAALFPSEIRNWDLLYVGGLDTAKECDKLSLARLFLPFPPSVPRPTPPSFTIPANCKDPWPTEAIEERYSLLSQISLVPGFHRTTTAYVITAMGAVQLLSVCFPLTFQLDTEMTKSATNLCWKVDAEPGKVQDEVNKEINVGEGGWKWPSLGYVRKPLCLTLQPPLISQLSEQDSDIQSAKPSVS